MDRARSLEAASRERPRSRIMDRKILPSGFSVFNPGGRSGRFRLKPQTARFFAPSPEIPSATQQTLQIQQKQSHTERSVQEIVCWMEKAERAVTNPVSVASPPVAEQHSSSQLNVTCKPATPTTVASSPCTTKMPSRGPPIAAAASAASEYTPLTMLEYRAYMNNRPLGRCLDDYPSEDDLLCNHNNAATVIVGDKRSDDQDADCDHLLKASGGGDPSPDSSSYHQVKLFTLARSNDGSGSEQENTKDNLGNMNTDCLPRGMSGDAVIALGEDVLVESHPVEAVVQPPISRLKVQNIPLKGHPFSLKDTGKKAGGPCTVSSNANGQSNISCNKFFTSHLKGQPGKSGTLPFIITETHVEKPRTPPRLQIGPETGAYGSGRSTDNQHISKAPRRLNERHEDKKGGVDILTQGRASQSPDYQAERQHQKPEQPSIYTAMTTTIASIPTKEPPHPPPLFTKPQPDPQRWRTVSESRSF